MAVNPYKWKPLPRNEGNSFWIRVLELEAGDRTDVLMCSLKFVCLTEDDDTNHNEDDDTNQYEAVSYCWGELHPRMRVYIDNGYVMAGRNIGFALVYLRRTDRTRRLWIDALCIDQLDLDEKASQIGQMSRIFGTARQQIASKWETIEELKKTKGIYWRYALSLDLPDFQKILQFFCNQYFERIWVVQEVAKARFAILQCGQDTMPWDDLAMAFHVLAKVYLPSGFPIHPNVATTRLLTQLAYLGGIQGKLSFLLREFSVRIAENPLDKIFALIGMLSPEDRARMPEIAPNYHVEVRNLYMDAAYYCILQDCNLDILSTCQAQNHRIANLPSWTPDWSFNYRDPSPTETIPMVNILRRFCHFRASDEAPCNAIRVGSSLALTGYVIDELEFLAEPLTIAQQRKFNHANTTMQVYNEHYEYRVMWLCLLERAVQARLEAGWRRLFDKHKRPSWLSASVPEEAYWLTITALDSRRLWETQRIRLDEDHVKRAYAVHKMLTTPTRLFVCLHMGLTIVALWEYLLTAMMTILRNIGWTKLSSRDLPLHTHGRRMGWTKKRRFANLPEDACLGDVVALVAGAKVPLILRPRGSDMFEIVGDAYVYGIMFGEAWDTDRCQRLVLV
ncbi:uncharacterized protein Z520_07285 [Fonsecaea multimorphosa CBS 102226]|uniref:Heterokaryon incompatibility domain-containing protein n=1 Tax=Fonsecaea multimorphosa CBS 102226 TaxID=1442371 RepID=A0A0D2IJD2_9EURO|nr:uncharacterized protein Z520_07285 [Fonsecaea multimorphosa CBS 102226]KIX97171.1 hypothetical protein Z520_07285 [Fonsecaea multimorphosa CBS 102226]OAL22946.1 hypothetical protein AYO22_06854 [Fonsecaea multimorphosa]